MASWRGIWSRWWGCGAGRRSSSWASRRGGSRKVRDGCRCGCWGLGCVRWRRGGDEENGVPQRLVVEGPYRFVRNPLYVTDFVLILGTALLANVPFLFLLAALYAAQLVLQLPLEERELRRRFGLRYGRYCRLVPRFVPRLRPVRQQDFD